MLVMEAGRETPNISSIVRTLYLNLDFIFCIFFQIPSIRHLGGGEASWHKFKKMLEIFCSIFQKKSIHKAFSYFFCSNLFIYCRKKDSEDKVVVLALKTFLRNPILPDLESQSFIPNLSIPFNCQIIISDYRINSKRIGVSGIYTSCFWI